MALCVQARVPIHVIGEPGTGKTAFIAALCRAVDYHLEVVVLSVREPADIAGFPIVGHTDDGKATLQLAPPDWALRASAAKRSVVFLDEFSCAPPAMQAAALRPVNEGDLAGLDLRHVSWAAASNPPEQAADGYDLSPPQANRWVHVEWTVDPLEWCQGMETGWMAPSVSILPEAWRCGIPASRALVASFIRKRPSLLQALPKESSERSGPWPSCRTMELVAKLHAACLAAGTSPSCLALGVQGAIGPGAGNEFLIWHQELDLPDLEDLLRDPGRFTPVERGDRAMAILAGLAATVASNPTRPRWDAAWTCVMVQAKRDKGVAVTAAVHLIRLLKALGGTVEGVIPPDAAEWAALARAAFSPTREA